MGNDSSKEEQTHAQSKLSNEEKRGLHGNLQKLKTVEGFSTCFHLTEVNLPPEKLARPLNLLIEPKSNPGMKSLGLPSDGHLFLLFYKFKSMKFLDRIHFYWTLFPSHQQFIEKALLFSTSDYCIEDDENAKFVVDGFVHWTQSLKEVYGSQLAYSDDKEQAILSLFVEKKAPRILIYFDKWMYQSFTGIELPVGGYPLTETEYAIDCVANDSIRWAITMSLPPQLLYISAEDQGIRNVDVFGTHYSLKHFTVSWSLLYCSNRHGSGMHRIGEAVYGYPSASLLLVETEDGSVFGGFIPSPWPRFEKKYFGDERCYLLSILPELKVFSTRGVSENFIRFPDKERRNDKRLGIGFGGQFNHERLWINGNDNFSTGKKTDMCSTYLPGCLGLEGDDFSIKRIQLWGFGGDEALEFREDVRQREDKFTERSKKLDPKSFFQSGQSLTENPDKMMMDWMSTKQKQ